MRPLLALLALAPALLAAPVPAADEKPKPRAKLLGTFTLDVEVQSAFWTPDGKLGLELLTAPAGSPAPLRPAVEADVAVLLRSSGTTGTPKLIPVTHGNLSAMAETFSSDRWFRLTAADRAACTAPSY